MTILGRCHAFRTFNGGAGINFLQIGATPYYFDIRQPLPGGSFQPYGNAMLFLNTGAGPVRFNLGTDTTVHVNPMLGWTVEGGATLILDENEPAVASAAYIAAVSTNQGAGTAIVMRGTTGRLMLWEDPTLSLNPNDPAYGSNPALPQSAYTLGAPCR